MRAAIYNPYLDTLGGGERYSVAFAKVLVDNGYSVDFGWKNKSIKDKLKERFGIDLTGINVVPDVRRGDGYDVMFWVSDGSVPLLRARRNFLHFQFPFKDVNGKTLINKMKFFRIDRIICNSYFTKGFIDKEYGVKSIVIYPPVDTDKFKPKLKEDIILFVGRFSQLTQSKNQHVLINVFKKLSKSVSGWRLVLAGGDEVGSEDYLKVLEKSSRQKDIEIIKSPDFLQLKDIYGKAKIFWSAVGYGSKENKEPQRSEHFGISVVEAMAAGAVPIVFESGGYKEIVSEGVNGYLWKKEAELVKKTLSLIRNPKMLKDVSKHSKEASNVYEYERFEAEVLGII